MSKKTPASCLGGLGQLLANWQILGKTPKWYGEFGFRRRTCPVAEIFYRSGRAGRDLGRPRTCQAASLPLLRGLLSTASLRAAAVSVGSEKLTNTYPFGSAMMETRSLSIGPPLTSRQAGIPVVLGCDSARACSGKNSIGLLSSQAQVVSQAGHPPPPPPPSPTEMREFRRDWGRCPLSCPLPITVLR